MNTNCLGATRREDQYLDARHVKKVYKLILRLSLIGDIGSFCLNAVLRVLVGRYRLKRIGPHYVLKQYQVKPNAPHVILDTPKVILNKFHEKLNKYLVAVDKAHAFDARSMVEMNGFKW